MEEFTSGDDNCASPSTGSAAGVVQELTSTVASSIRAKKCGEWADIAEKRVYHVDVFLSFSLRL